VSKAARFIALSITQGAVSLSQRKAAMKVWVPVASVDRNVV
jgi:hypothetical protein